MPLRGSHGGARAESPIRQKLGEPGPLFGQSFDKKPMTPNYASNPRTRQKFNFTSGMSLTRASKNGDKISTIENGPIISSLSHANTFRSGTQVEQMGKGQSCEVSTHSTIRPKNINI